MPESLQPEEGSSQPKLKVESGADLNLSGLNRAIAATSSWLLARQEVNGAWVGEVNLNPGPTAQAVMLHAGIRRDFPAKLAPKAKAYILRTQNPDGGWSPFYGSQSEVSLTCECYLALRLLGEPPESSVCARARQRISALGGIEQANAWTHLYFAVLGVLPWDAIYKTPIEAVLIPETWPVGLRQMSYWVKVITVPMALLAHLGPGQEILLASAVAMELDVDKNHFTVPAKGLFLKYVYPLTRHLSRLGTGVQAKSVRKCWKWINSFTEAHGDFGGNTCTAMNVLLSLYLSGRSNEPKFEAGLVAMMGYAFEDDREWRLQTCQSHVWDTGLALMALPQPPFNNGAEAAAAGTAATTTAAPAAREKIAKGVKWLKENQILKVRGDWNLQVDAEPGGWCFGDRHEHFPVLDCTAVALMGMLHHDPSTLKNPNALRGVRWLLAMQHDRGGWSSYERFQGVDWINKVIRFKDIDNALTDVPKADVSSKVVEALVKWRGELKSEVEPALFEARRFLLSKRVSEGPAKGLWSGNYGVNYIYGTSFSCKALREIDGIPTPEWADVCREFFLRRQNADGGWGEAEESYRDPERAGRGPSSPVQTAWALLGLCACSEKKPEVVQALVRGVKYLLLSQSSEGNWSDPWYLGTVFPGMVYFRYSYYATYFPLMSLIAVRQYFGRGRSWPLQ